MIPQGVIGQFHSKENKIHSGAGRAGFVYSMRSHVRIILQLVSHFELMDLGETD
jgi:hypothetical protein